MEPRIQYAKTKDGVKLAYFVIGEGKPLVFPSSGPVTNTQLDWRSSQSRGFLLALAEGRSLVRYDGRGLGLSEEGVGPRTLDSCILDLEAVVEALRLESFSLLAASFAGPPAIAYAARHPDRVSELILWCASSRNAEVVTSPADRALGALREADWHLFTEVVAFIGVGWHGGDAGPSYAKSLRETYSPDKYRQVFAEMFRLDASAELEDVKARTLVMQRNSPGPMRGEAMGASRALAATIPGAELLIFEDEAISGTVVSGDTAFTITTINEFLRKGEAQQKNAPATDVHTILFTDMEASTALTRRLGDAAAQDIRRAHDTIVRGALSSHSGKEIKHTGDGIMASFTTASAALESAIAIQQGVAAHVGQQPDSPLAVYIGLNAGEPIAENEDLFGTSVDLAARICGHADAGQIVASDVVRQLAAGKQFLFADLGETALRGFEDPVKLWEVRWRESE